MPVIPIDPKDLTFDTELAKEIGARPAAKYQGSVPYDHICLDDFLPIEVIEKVRVDLDSLPDAERCFDAANEKFESQYNPDRLPHYSPTSSKPSTSGPSSAFRRR